MEKFSAYRDPGTGIQPFLTPVAPLGNEFLEKATLPIRLVLGVLRTALVLLLFITYFAVIRTASLVFIPIPPLYRLIEHIFLFIFGRTILFILGLFWIAPEQATTKRGRKVREIETWKPKAGDVIVSNWISWIEVVWLAISYNPIFVIPIPESLPDLSESSRSSTPLSFTPGRRTGTGSANVQLPSKTATQREPIRKFREVSLLSMINKTGHVPPFGFEKGNAKTLEEIRKGASKPVVLFPECTTSNGRGLLRFADVFHQTAPVKGYQVYVMCVRYDPPTSVSPTASLAIPSSFLNPLPHAFTLAKSLTPLQISIRQLPPSESPSSPLIVVSELLSDFSGEDQVSEICAALIAQIGKLKRTGMAWEDKFKFLDFYSAKGR
ncbi:hypothetical protein CVT24_008341 [Panaeolus cyanescens]|uniref:Phospholipid/glycerol acyltransferase domain-containing protein n=1 Tax=Panaeolus cyanescens TaxID=181874 RepID=A0A409VCB5_9AGAR|nr:hypothetical protein CVT24_008341 [Panaeolus cyanescens]